MGYKLQETDVKLLDLEGLQLLNRLLHKAVEEKAHFFCLDYGIKRYDNVPVLYHVAGAIFFDGIKVVLSKDLHDPRMSQELRDEIKEFLDKTLSL